MSTAAKNHPHAARGREVHATARGRVTTVATVFAAWVSVEATATRSETSQRDVPKPGEYASVESGARPIHPAAAVPSGDSALATRRSVASDCNTSAATDHRGSAMSSRPQRRGSAAVERPWMSIGPSAKKIITVPCIVRSAV
ncbi:MAG: hypothetical protein R3A52_24715 [Polyangiales bacterium]